MRSRAMPPNHIAPPVGVARETSHGDRRREGRDRQPRGKGSQQRGERARRTDGVGGNQLTGRVSHFVSQRRDTDRIGGFHEDGVADLQARRDAKAYHGYGGCLRRALHDVRDPRTGHFLIQRIDNERRDGDHRIPNRVGNSRNRERIKQGDRITQREGVRDGIACGERPGDLVAERPHFVARTSGE